jgi:hypothetical protein
VVDQALKRPPFRGLSLALVLHGEQLMNAQLKSMLVLELIAVLVGLAACAKYPVKGPGPTTPSVATVPAPAR